MPPRTVTDLTVTEPARAKINLALHVTGQRADGYHLLDSLVAFAEIADQVTAAPANRLSLTIDGPQAGGLDPGADNLMLRAARLFDPACAARLGLTKTLPVASGIGGGSADAAATLRALARLTGRPLPLAADTAALGADVPVCLAGVPARMRGIGERLTPVAMPPGWIVLANPRCPVATPAVFSGLARKDNPALPDRLPDWRDIVALAAWLKDQRNDLEPPARAIAPPIGAVLAALGACPGALIARMSGSGATAFALFASQAAARAAAARIGAAEPNWWATAGQLSGSDGQSAQLSRATT